MNKMKLNLQYFASGTSNQIGIDITLNPETFNTNLAKLRKQITAFQTNINAIKLNDDFEKSLSSVNKVLDSSESQLNLYTRALAEVQRQMETVTQRYKDGEMSTSAYETEMTSLIVTQESYKKNINALKTSIKEYKDIQDSAALTGQTFQKRLDNIDTELLKIDKSFNKSVSHLTNWENTTEGLNNKIGYLNQTLNTQQKRLETLSDEYDRVNAKSGASQKQKNELIKSITKEYEAIAKTKSALVKYEDSLNDTGRKAKELKSKIDGLVKSYIDEVKASGKSSDKAKSLKSTINKLSREYIGLEQEIKSADNAQEKANKGWTIGKQILSDLARQGIQLVVQGLKDMITGVANSSITWESAFAGVRKTVEASEKDLKNLEKQLLNLSKRVPTTANDIARVAEIAGQLGIDTDNITGFTETIIGMSEAFEGVSAEDAAISLAKFANITKMNQKDYERLGSVITELGNNFPTLEGDMIEMATRIAATGEVVGLTESQIMGLSTAISSVGVEAEAGGTAISKLLKKMNTSSQGFDSAQAMIERTNLSLRDLELMASNDSTSFKKLTDSLGLTQKELKGSMNIVKSFGQYASTAGYDVKEFAKIYEKDAVEAMTLFVDGLNNVERNGKNAVEILNDMGLTEVRLSNTILALAGSDIKLTDAIGMANNAWNENIALQTEVDKRYETTESKIAMLRNSFTALGITLFGTVKDSFIDAVKSMSDETNLFIDGLEGDKGLKGKLSEMGKSLGEAAKAIFKSLKDIMPVLLDLIISLGKFAGKIIPTITRVLTSLFKIVTKITTALVKNEKLLSVLTAGLLTYKIVTAAVTKLITIQTVAKKLWTLATNKATISQLALNAAQLASPWGLAAAGIAAIVTGLVLFSKRTKESDTEQEKLNKSIKKSSEYLKEAKEAYKEVDKAKKDAIDASLAEGEKNKDLFSELKLIVDENGKIKSGYEDRANFIVNELRDALGVEIEINKGVIQSYVEVQKAIEETIAKKRALAIIEAQEEAAAEGEKFVNDDENVEARKQALSDYKKAKKLYDAKQKEREEIKSDLSYLKEAYDKAYDLNKTDQIDWEGLEEYGIEKGQYGKIDTVYNEYTDRLEEVEEDLDEKTKDSTAKTLKDAKKVLDKIDKLWENAYIDMASYDKSMGLYSEKKYDEISGKYVDVIIGISDAANKIIKTAEKEIESSTQRLDAYIRDYKNYSGEVREQAEKQIVEQVKALSKTRQALLDAYNEATTEEDRKTILNKIKETDEEIKKYLNKNEITEIIKSQLDNTITNINKGIKNEGDKLKLNFKLTGDQYRLLWEKIKETTNGGKTVTQKDLDTWSQQLVNSISPEDIELVKDKATELWTAIYGEFKLGESLTQEQMDELMLGINTAIANGTPLTLSLIDGLLKEMGLKLETNTDVEEKAGLLGVAAGNKFTTSANTSAKFEPPIITELSKVKNSLLTSAESKSAADASGALAMNMGNSFTNSLKFTKVTSNELDDTSTLLEEDETVSNASKTFGKNIKSSYDINLNSKDKNGDTPVDNFIKTSANTFNSGKYRQQSINAAATLAKDQLNAYNTELGIASPSKEAIKSARYFIQGLLFGFKSDEDRVIDEVKTFGETLTGTLQDSLGLVKANVIGSVNLDGNVNGGKFAGQNQSNSKVVNWTQNYSSPKPMSRYEMYVENKRLKNQILQELNN